jgi:hypothetical protein
MSSNLKDYVPEWFKKLLNPAPKITEATYNGKKVFVHRRTDTYAIITYHESGEGLFKVDLAELVE